jgi:urease accessory protein
MDRADFHGPLRVQRPFYPEGNKGACHVYILHPPGGIVSGDALHIDAHCRPGTHALLTTPSAGKIYKADSQNIAQQQTITLRVQDGICEWLPMETLVFNGANARLVTRIQLEGGSRFIGWDILCLGRPESGLFFSKGSLIQTLDITHDRVPLLREHFAVDGRNHAFLQGAFGLGNHCSVGTFFAVLPGPDAPNLVHTLRDALPQPTTGQWAITSRRRVLLLRYLGPRADEATTLFRQAWKLVRPRLLDREAMPPRIWST